jgi:hypothetical protein
LGGRVERRRGLRLGRPENGHDGNAQGVGHVHRPGVVGDEERGLGDHGQEPAQGRPPSQVDRLGLHGRSYRGCDFGLAGRARQDDLGLPFRGQPVGQGGEAVRRPALGRPIGRARVEYGPGPAPVEAFFGQVGAGRGPLVVGDAQAQIGRHGFDAQAREQLQIIIKMMARLGLGIGRLDAAGQERAAAVAPVSPALGDAGPVERQGRTERIGQQHGQIEFLIAQDPGGRLQPGRGLGRGEGQNGAAARLGSENFADPVGGRDGDLGIGEMRR